MAAEHEVPEGLTREARALFYIAHVVSRHMDPDAVQVLREHVVQVNCKKGDVGQDFVIAALDAFHADHDLKALLSCLECFVNTALASGSVDIGTAIFSSPTNVAKHPHITAHDDNNVIAISASGSDAFTGLSAHKERRTSITPDGTHVRVTGGSLLTKADSSMLSPAPGPLLPVTIVYYAKDMEEVAHELANGPAKHLVVLHEIDWKTFPDGFPNLFIRNIKDCRFHSVMFLASFHSMHSIMEQIAVIYALPGSSKRFSVMLPFFPTGTMERISVIGEVATAKTLARMLSATPLAANGPPVFSILDIHALQEQFYFGDNVHVRLKSCITLLHDRLIRLKDAANVRIAFPDDGAYKRFSGKLDTFGETIVCSKRREGDRRRIVIQDGDCVGKHCVIVDDLVQTGGTLLECAKALKDAAALAVSAYVTHAVFPVDSWKKFVPAPGEEGPLRYFFITNSIPTTAKKLAGLAPFEVLSIAPVIADILGL